MWRVLRAGGDDYPLAYCDSRSLKQEDLLPSRLLFEAPTPEGTLFILLHSSFLSIINDSLTVSRHALGETYQVKYSVNHRFYFLSAMSPDEAIFLQCWNSDPKAAKTPHSGIVNEGMVGKGLARRSIEIRALVFWD